MISSGNFVVAENLNIHVVRTPDEIFAFVDFVIFAFARTFNANNQAADGTNLVHQKFGNCVVVSFRSRLFFLHGCFEIAIRANRSVTSRTEKMSVLTADKTVHQNSFFCGLIQLQSAQADKNDVAQIEFARLRGTQFENFVRRGFLNGNAVFAVQIFNVPISAGVI